MPPLGRLSHIVVDCTDPQRLAAFWTGALDVEIAAYWHQYVILTPTVEGGPAIAFQEVPEAKQTKNRVHVDVEVADLDAASAQVERLGGAVIGDVEEDGVAVRVVTDPEGNEFCLVRQLAPLQHRRLPG